MKKEGFLFFILFGLGVFLGYYLVMGSWKGFRTSRVSTKDRKVADVREPMKQALLIKEELRFEENIILGAQVVFDSQRGINGIEFGNFLNSEGEDLCSYFSGIEMVLFGEGIAISGNHPRITIEGICPLGKKLLENGVRDRAPIFDIFQAGDCEKRPEKDSYTFENGTQVRLNTRDFILSEPRWLVEKITFVHSSFSSNDLEFSSHDIKKILSEANRDSSFIEIPCLAN